MTFDKLKAAIQDLTRKERNDLQDWLKRDMAEEDGEDLGEPTPDQLDALLSLRTFELDGRPTDAMSLARHLGIDKKALVGRLFRLNKTVFGKYTQSRDTNDAAVYSTLYNRMIRQPATAVMALVFTAGNVSSISKGEFEQFGSCRDIGNVKYYTDYLVRLKYFEDRGGDIFAPADRLELEDRYLRGLASRWAVQSPDDMAEVTRCKNEILFAVWQQEYVRKARADARTSRALTQLVSAEPKDERTRKLAEHALGSLIADGSLKERIGYESGEPILFLNERDDPGHSVVTRTGTALLLNALCQNSFPDGEKHSVSIEAFVAFALMQGLALHTVQAALTFCERASYIAVDRVGSHVVRIWRTERLHAQELFISRLAAEHIP